MSKVLLLLLRPGVVQESVHVNRKRQLVKPAAAPGHNPSRHQTQLPQNQRLRHPVDNAAMYGISTNTVSGRFRLGWSRTAVKQRMRLKLPLMLGVLRPRLGRQLLQPQIQMRLILPYQNQLTQRQLPHHPSIQMSPHVRRASSLLSIRRRLVRRQLRILRRRRIRLFHQHCALQTLHRETEFVFSPIRAPVIRHEIADHLVQRGGRHSKDVLALTYPR